MNEPYGQLLATLHKTQGTMAVQLDRLAKSQAPDRVRLPRLECEARQFRGATEALLARMMEREVSPDLIVQAKLLLAHFEHAVRRAASISSWHGQVDAGARDEPDDEVIDGQAGPGDNHEPDVVPTAGPNRPRLATESTVREIRVARQMARLGPSGSRSAQARGGQRQRSAV
ncbi:hypothetical protein [Rubellimicrobium roseum]|uniref:Uncharacterized protein n=1 Tax=Rubellimicrobium roseum TaxID=687525 RepID=A0A5C4N636_9RHOB|nr:hypothetical protein [Rubellimicrobium roseum]TNC59694.1 hypothetical protein FHG71_22580 [Rubellimicrobium roseum]